MERLDRQEAWPQPQSPSPAERRLSPLIVGLLMLIVAVLAFEQSKFDPSVWQERPDNQISSPAARRPQDVSPATDPDAVTGLEPMSAPEQYDAATLSNKINGKAELYLSAGFNHLETRRFSVSGDAAAWMERFIYDMGAQRNAFAVFSAQRRRAAAPLDMVKHGYLASNGLFLVHGPYYVEIIATQATERIQAHMQALASRFVATHDFSEEDIIELALFPPEHQVPESIVLIADSAFGLEGLDWVFTAAYHNDPDRATAFVTRCRTTAEAQSLASALTAFWTEYGGEIVTPPAQLQEAQVVTLLDNFEIVVVQGRYLVGVHEATRLDFGADVTARLQQMVREQVP